MILTTWGYTLTEINALPDMLDQDEFDKFSANRYSGDIRIPGEIRAACAAIRNYCGWHVYPSAMCELSVTMDDRRVSYIGRDLLIQLPSKCVTAVRSVKINDVAYTTFRAETNGILKIYDVSFLGLHRYTPIYIIFDSGLTDDMMDAIKELVAHRVTHAAASSNGITSEAAGGVSVTYNANWINSARATALPDDNKEVLAPYRLQGGF